MGFKVSVKFIKDGKPETITEFHTNQQAAQACLNYILKRLASVKIVNREITPIYW